MKHWVLYMSPLCPDCTPVMEELKNRKQEIEVVDITGSMAALKRFLKLRDSLDAFVPVKEAGQVGIPVLVKNEGEEVIFDVSDFDYE